MDDNSYGLDDVLEQQRDQAQLRATYKVADSIAKLAEIESRKQQMPQCPFCGGRLEGRFELCSHCRSKIAWVRRIPCKPGEEAQLAESLKRQDLANAYEARRANFIREQLGVWPGTLEVCKVLSLMALLFYVGMWGVTAMCFIVNDVTFPQTFANFRTERPLLFYSLYVGVLLLPPALYALPRYMVGKRLLHAEKLFAMIVNAETKRSSH